MNYKVKVNNEAESKEVQELFFEMGYDFHFCGKTHCNPHLDIVTANKDGLMANIELDGFEYKELTIQQLKDMVVLKRNSIDDATHMTTDDVWKFYIGYDTYCYERKNGVIGWHKEDSKCYDLKPIKEKGMQEFLVNYDDKWVLRLLDSDTQENSYRVAVPEGAEVLKVFLGCESGFCFYKDNYTKIWQDFVEKPYCGEY